MPRMKRVTVSGAVLEQEIFNVAPNTKNVKGAVPKPLTERTAEEKEKYNLKQALKRFIRIVNHNFSPTAFYVTNTFDNSWKAKAENLLKIQKENPETPIDFNNITGG